METPVKLKDIEDVRQLIQDDLAGLLEGYPCVISDACRIVVNRFEKLIETLR